MPHFTTFQKAAQRRRLATSARRMFDAVLQRALRSGVRKRRVPLAAIDGTGLESRYTSRYYVQRRSQGGDRDQTRTYAKYPKVIFVVDCGSHMILAAAPVEDRARTRSSSARPWVRPSAVHGSGRCWPTRTSTRSGFIAVSGRTALGPSSHPSADDRPTSCRRAVDGAGR